MGKLIDLSHTIRNGLVPFKGLSARLVCCTLLLGLSGCSSRTPDRDRLAAQGMIQANAPVQAAAEIAVSAPMVRVWGLLLDIENWPRWQPDISRVSIEGAPAIGTRFSWSTGGMEIHSTIRLIDPQRRLCWTGHMLYFHAIHCWTLGVLPDGRVSVKVRESPDGWLISHIYSSHDLLETDQRWLARLRDAAEH